MVFAALLFLVIWFALLFSPECLPQSSPVLSLQTELLWLVGNYKKHEEIATTAFYAFINVACKIAADNTTSPTRQPLLLTYVSYLFSLDAIMEKKVRQR